MTRPKKILFAILLLAAILRIVGAPHGLPLFVADDEPPFVLAALKMLELKTLLPAAHDEFQDFLYYPPYLAYLLLPFFALVSGFIYLQVGNVDVLKIAVASDPSVFFLTARLVTVALGVLSVYFIYRFVLNMWKEDTPALWAAFFAAMSLLAVTLSSVARHWTAVFFIFSVILFFLSNYALSVRKRYTYSLVAAGVGFGISTIAVAALPFITIWFLFYDRMQWKMILRADWLVRIVPALFLLFALPLALYPQSMGFLVEATPAFPPIWRIFASPFVFGYPFIVSEPIFAVLALAGLALAFRKDKRFFWLAVFGLYGYALLFLFLFRFEARFFLPLLPILAALAGLALSRIRLRVGIFVGALILVCAARLSFLAAAGDTREIARAWVEENIPHESKIVSYGKGLRLSKTRAASAEQEALDGASVRAADRADAALPEDALIARFHSVNLYALQNAAFWEDAPSYLASNQYKYLLLADESENQEARIELLKEVGMSGALVQEFAGTFGEGIRYADGHFAGGIPALFSARSLGPDVVLYELK